MSHKAVPVAQLQDVVDHAACLHMLMVACSDLITCNPQINPGFVGEQAVRLLPTKACSMLLLDSCRCSTAWQYQQKASTPILQLQGVRPCVGNHSVPAG